MAVLGCDKFCQRINVPFSLTGAGTLRSWLVDSSSIDHLGKDIETIQLHLGQLSNMIDTLDDISVRLEYACLFARV